MKTFAFLAAALLVSGCAVAPRPVPPKPLVPSAQWSVDDAAVAAGQMRFDWWTRFGSAQLDGFVAKALEANREIAVADANLAAVRALAQEARAARGPSGGVSGAVQRSRFASFAQPPTFITGESFADQTLADVGAQLSWELDLAGGAAARSAAARSDAGAALWQKRRIEAGVAAQTVRAWLDLIRTQAIRDLVDRRIRLLDSAVGMMKARNRFGAVVAADVAVLEQARAAAASSIPSLDLAARNALRRIAVLTGQDPIAFVRDNANLHAEAQIPADLAAPDPGTLLRQRPDVRAAENRVLAAYERTGIPRAALYPSISLGANAGLNAAPADLGKAGAFRFAIGPSLNWGIFNLARVRAEIRASDAVAKGAAAEWEQTILLAIEEADSALDAWRAARLASANAAAAQQAARIRAEAVRAKRLAGLSSPLDLAQSEAELLLADLDLQTAQASEREAWATANLAMGAGWREEAPPAR